MAVRRRRRRRRTYNRRRRSSNPIVRVRANRSYARYRVRRRRRRSNPVRRRRYGARHRNPSITSLFTKGLWVGGGVFLTDAVQSIVPFSWGGDAGRIAVRFGTAWLLGTATERVVGAANAELLALGGVAGAMQDLIRLLWGQLGGAFTPAPSAAQIAAQQAAQLSAMSGGYDGMGMITYAPEGYPVDG